LTVLLRRRNETVMPGFPRTGRTSAVSARYLRSTTRAGRRARRPKTAVDCIQRPSSVDLLHLRGRNCPPLRPCATLTAPYRFEVHGDAGLDVAPQIRAQGRSHRVAGGACMAGRCARSGNLTSSESPAAATRSRTASLRAGVDARGRRRRASTPTRATAGVECDALPPNQPSTREKPTPAVRGRRHHIVALTARKTSFIVDPAAPEAATSTFRRRPVGEAQLLQITQQLGEVRGGGTAEGLGDS